MATGPVALAMSTWQLLQFLFELVVFKNDLEYNSNALVKMSQREILSYGFAFLLLL